MPTSELGWLREGLAYFTFAGSVPAGFLPRSAAGIFASNLTGAGSRDDAVAGSRRDAGWLSDVIGTQVADPYELYAAQQDASVRRLGVGHSDER